MAQRRNRTTMSPESGEMLLPPERPDSSHGTGIGKEWRSISLLVLLYILQGIPLGMSAAFTMFLQNRTITYKQQALFSLVFWPFSVKFLWAPIVDSLHWHQFGRRKSWLVPVQYLIGIFLLVLSRTLPSWFGDDNSSTPNVLILTGIFFALNFLAATQDIAVDGWALTMLSRRNVAYASTCNTVGQTAGYFLGHVVFLALESKDFANKYIYSTPQPYGLVTMAGFMAFWAWVFFVTTTLVAVFKREEEIAEDEDHGVIETYKLTGKILMMPSVLSIAAVLLTCKIGFGITDGATGLKLIEAGVHRENLALLSIPMTPLQILLPLVLSRYITGNRPLDIFLKTYPLRLIFGLIFALMVKWTFTFGGEFPVYYYVVIVLLYAVHQVFVYCGFVALMAFFARVSDPSIGGTYMTLLNTLNNIGGNWPSTLSLWLIDFVTYKACPAGADISCYDSEGRAQCKALNSECATTLDGYYVESVVAVALGFIWLALYGRRAVIHIQRIPIREWQLFGSNGEVKQ